MLKIIRSRRIPATCTRMSRRPHVSTTWRTIAAASSGSDTEPKFAAARPPSFTISSTTWAAGCLSLPSPLKLTPRSLTTTRAPAFANASAMPRPMPRPAPVTNAVLPARMLMVSPEKGSLPGPDGLLEVVDARGPAVHDHLAHLVNDGGRRGVNQPREERQLDHGAVAFGNADEGRDARSFEIAERHQMKTRHLVGIRFEILGGARPDDHRGDDEARPGPVVVQQAEHGVLTQLQPDFFTQLAQRCASRALPGVHAATRQRPLARVGAQRRRPPREEKAGASRVVGQQDRGDGGWTMTVGGEGTPVEGPNVGESALVERLVEAYRVRAHRRRPL